MSLIFKKSYREDVSNATVYIDDKSALSPNYFRVSDVPQILTKGKNLIRISGHPTNLKDGTQVYINIKDSNGNDIYYEIPDYIEEDKSRVLSIWIYHDKGDDNTANGEAVITLVGIATKDENGRAIPAGYKDKINVRWQTKVNVDRNRDSVTPILFNTLVSQPELSLSESIEVYENQPQSGNRLNLTTQQGKIRYILKGETPIVQILDGTTFNEEMLKSSIVLSNYTEPATPACKKGEPTNLNSFSGSISKLINSTNAQLNNPYTASFEDREGLKHSYDSIEEANYTVQYVQSGSNVSTENQRSFVNISFANVDPMVGVVDKVKVLHKSDGLPGEFELLNEVSVPFTSSFSVKIPLPSENLQDPKLLKIQYLNSIGEISRTETTVGPFVFEGGNQYIGGSQNLISGSIFISNTIGTGIEIGGASSGFMRSVGFNGQTSASLGLSPGGFVIYSGSSNLRMGVDQLDGVGMQMIGDNDDRHFIFTTANGGLLDVKTDKFFIGTTGSQFISGSNNNIEISSSLFHLDPANSSLVIGAGATINADLSVNNIFSPSGTNVNTSKAAITAQGFAKFTSASIGGLKLDDNKLFTGTGTYGNANTGFYVDSGSQFALGNKLVWNPTTQALVIRGQLQLSDGSDVGNALAAATSSNTAKIVELNADKYVITFNSLGNQDPAGQTITLTATQQNHNGTVYYEFYKGASLQGSRGTSNTFVADQSSELPTASTPVTYQVKTFEVSSGGSVIANDTLTLFGVQAGASGSDGSAGSDGSDGTDGTDGQDAVTAFLTNEAHTFAANPDKSIVSFTGGSTNMIVFEGVTDKTNSYTYTRSSTTSVSSSISSNTITVTAMGHDSGSLIITATSASTSLSKTMSLSKAIAGQTGSDGTDGAAGLDGSTAKTLTATVDSQVFAFDNSVDTTATPTKITFSFNQQNLNAAIGSSDITVSTAGGNVTNFGFDNNGVTNSGGKHSGISSGSISFTGALNSGGLNSTKTNLPVTVSVSKDGLADSIKVFKVQGGDTGSDGSDGAAGAAGVDGTDAVTTFLTNESHTFTAQSNGTIISFVGGSTDMEVFEGVTNKTSNYTISASNGPGVSSSLAPPKSVNIGAMSHDSGSVTITAKSASVSLSKSMSLTKSKQGTAGLAGSDAKLLSLSSDSQVFSFPSASSSTAIDNDILITINQQNLSGEVGTGDFTIVDSGGNTLSDPTLKASVTDGTGQVSGSITFSSTVGGNKTKLPLTVTVSKDSLEDSLKIFKVEGGTAGSDGSDGSDGAAGTDGTDAVTAFLTNESHTFPADFSGSIASFVGGSTDMEVFEGVTNRTANYTISSSRGLGVVANDSGKTVTISALGHDSGSVSITATSASVSLTKTMSLTKARQGGDGTDGTSAKLLIGSLDSQVFAFDNSTDTSSDPLKVFFSFQQQNLSAAIVAGDLTITTAGGSNITNFGFNNANISSGTGIVSGSIVFSQALNNGGAAGTKSNLPINISATKDGLQDSVKIFKVEGGNAGADGQSARTMILTNESHTFAAQPNGNIISFTGGDTDVSVFTGTTNTTSAYTISASSTTSVSSSVSSNTVTVTSMGHDSGSLIINAISASGAAGEVSLTKLMSLTKAKQGTDGADGNDGTDGTDGNDGVNGTSAKSLTISTDSQVFAFDNSVDTTATPSSIVFTINQQNLSHTIDTGDITITKTGGGTITTPSIGGIISAGSGLLSGSITYDNGASAAAGKVVSKNHLPITISVSNNANNLSDSTKIFKVVGGDTGSDGAAGAAGADGSDAVTTFLTNEAHTFAALNNGNIVSFVGGSTDMEVFEGVTNKTSNYTISSSRGLGVVATDSGKTVTITALSHDSGSVNITATSASVSLTKTMSLVKSKQGTAGLAGADAKTLLISSDSQVFSFPSASSSTAIDNDILLTISQQNLSGTIGTGDLTIVDAQGNTLSDPTLKTSVTDGSGQVSGSITFSSTVSGNKTKLPLTVTVTKDSLEDSLRIFKVEGGTAGSDGAAGSDGTDGTDGTSAVSAFLTNESHTFPSDVNGGIASFVGGSTDMEVFEGVTNVTSNYTISSSRGLGVVASDSGKTVTVSALGHDSGSLTITATSASVSLSKTMSLTKARQGSAGSDGTSAKLLAGSLDSQVFSFDNSVDTTSSPSSIVFSFNQQNLNAAIGSSDITVSTAGGNVTGFGFDNNDVSSGTGVVSGSISFTGALNSGGLNSTKSNLPVTITATKNGLSDSVKIFKVVGGDTGSDGSDGSDGAAGSDGVSAVTAFLTNDSHTLPISSSNTIISLTGATTDIEVFEGVTNKTSNYTVSQTKPSHFTTTLSGKTLTITSGSFPHTGSIVLTATSASVSLAKTMSISIARQGDDGTDGTDGTDGNDGVDGTSAKILSITSDSQVFGFDNSVDTTATPSSIVFTVAQQNLAHTIDTGDITITKAGSSTLTTPSLSGTVNSGTGQQTFTVPFSSLTKSDLPLTVAVSNNANNLSDSIKIFKVAGGDTGSDGTDGSDAVTAFLTNESHTFAALNNGTIVSFTGGSTDMEVFEGVTNKTSAYTISRASTTSVSSSISGKTVTITSMGHDSGSVVITAASASVSLSKTMTLSKSKQGTAGLAGADAKSVSIVADSQTFAFDNSVDTSATPTSIGFTVNQQNLSGTIATSDITITKAGGSAFTTPTLGGSVSSGTGTRTFSLAFSSFSKSDLPLSIAVSKDSLSDSTKIFKVQGGDTGSDGSDGAAGTDGTSAVTAFLTNESHTFPADFSGSIASFVGGSTDMEVFEGVTNKTSAYTISRASTTSVSSSISGKTVTVTSMAHDSGSIVVTAASASTSLSKTMSLVKSRQGGVGATGIQGAAGSDSKTVSLVAANNVITYNAAGSSPSPSSTITLTATSQNFTNGFFKFTGDGISDEGSYTDGSGANSDTFSFSVPSSYFSTPKAIRVGVADGNQSELAFDTVSIVAVQPGTDGSAGAPGSDGTSALTAFLTSDGDIVPAANDGTVSSFVGSGTEMIIFQGATDVSSAFNTVTRTNSTGLSSTLSGKTLTITGMNHDSGSVVITATSASGDAGQVAISKTYSIGKSKAGATGDTGAAGSNAKTIVVGAASTIFVKAQNGTITPSSIVITANGQNLTSAGAFSTTAGTLSSTSVSTSGGSTTVTSGNFSDGMIVTYTTAGGDGSLTDSVTLKQLDEGSGNITAVLDNEAHVLPASATGAVSSYANSGTTIRCFEGATALTFVTGTPGTGEFGVSVGNTANITEGSITDSGTFCTIGNHSGAADGTDQYVITYTISGKTLNGTDFTTFTKTQSLTKSKVGATGPQGNAGTNNQDFSFLDASLGVVNTTGGLSAGLLMTSNVFGFHNAISEGDGTNATLADFTSFLDSGGSFYLGGNSSGASNPSDGYFAWNNTDKSLLISGSNARIDVDKFFVGKSTTQFISGSNGNIEISSSKFHIKPDGDIIVKKVTADDGTIGGFTLSDTQINSSNNNLILKASGQVTASTLLLTGGSVAGMPVSSDEISVGEILKLKQSGQITGSQVLFKGGNIGGFQLEDSSLFQSSGTNLVVSASFKIGTRFGDFGNVPRFEYEPQVGDISFYIEDIQTNLPNKSDLGLILKSDSIISGSKISGATAALFSSGSNYGSNSTHLAIVDKYDPVSQLLTLKPGLNIGYGGSAVDQPNSYNSRSIDIVAGVTYTTSLGNEPTFNESSKTTSFSIAQKDTSNLILSSSGELTAQSGKIGDFTISDTDIELITQIEDRNELVDFRIYNTATLPFQARQFDQPSDNNGRALKIYIKKPNGKYYNGWEVERISNAQQNGSADSYGNYIAISSSARSSSGNSFSPTVYDNSQLPALGFNNSQWPLGGGGSYTFTNLGYSYVPSTTNTLGQNENWYLEYYAEPAGINGVSSGGIASGYPGYETALVSFLSGSVDTTPVQFTVLAHTASFVSRAESSDRANAGIWINMESNNIEGSVFAGLADLPQNNLQTALLIDGGGTKFSNIGKPNLSNGLLVTTPSQKSNFWENPTQNGFFYSPIGWPTKTGFDLKTTMYLDPRLINEFTSSISSSYLKRSSESPNYWAEQDLDGNTLASLLQYPFLHSREAQGDGFSAENIKSQLFDKMNQLFSDDGWSSARLSYLGELGFELSQTASILIAPYADSGTGGFVNLNGDIDESHIYVANLAYNEGDLKPPTFLTSSDGQGSGFAPSRNITLATGGGGKHIVILEKGFFLNPLWDKVLSNHGNGVLAKNADGENPSLPANYEGETGAGADAAWTRFLNHSNNSTYNVSESPTPLMGLPFTIGHSYVTGSSTLTNKATLKNAIYPDTIDVRGQITADNDNEGAFVPGANFELNEWLNGAYDDVAITNRISDTVIETGLTNAQQTAFKSNFGTRAYTGVRFHFNHTVPTRFGDGTIRMGTTSGSFREGSVLKISGSGQISSSNYIQKSDGQVTGSKVSFLGGKISGSDMSITANEFDFKTDFGNIKGNSTTFELSSSLLNLTPNTLNVKGDIQAQTVYGQDTFLAGKIVSTPVKNPEFSSVFYDLPFVEVYATQSTDARLNTGSFIMKTNGTTPQSTQHLNNTGSTIVGNHKSFTLSSNLQSKPQFLVPTTNDGVGYPSEFKSWKSISGVDNDYVFVSNVSATNASEASGSISSTLIGNQLVFNEATASKILFNGSNALTPSNAFSSITTDTIKLYDVLNSDRENVHLQFAIRGTAHPSTGSFNGYNPEYKVEVLDTSGSAVVWQKSYKDTKATHKNWAVFDIPMTDIATYYQQNIPFNSSTGSYDEGSYNGTSADGLKVKISMRYSGSSVMTTRLSEGTRFGGSNNLASGSFTLGFALTEMRMVEPVRITSLDTQTVHLKDTYLTWHDNPATTGHYGNFVPEFTSSATTSSFSLGAPKEKWDSIYLNLKEENLYPVETLVGAVSQSNKFVRINTHTGKLTYTSASAGSGGGGGGSYSHPTHPGDDFSVDTGTLTGATVVSDIDINVTTDGLGHVTDANGSVSTRTLTLANLGYTGATNANNYVLPTNLAGDDINIDTGALTGATVISDLDFNVTTNTSGLVTDANGTVATRTLTLANLGYTGDTDATNNTGTVTGTGTNNRVALWNGTTAIDSDSDLTFDGTTLATSRLRSANGSVSSPSIAFTNQTDTGWYLINTHDIGVTIDGTQRGLWDDNGLKLLNGALGVSVNASTTNGRIDASNDIVAYSTSDKRLKENIKTIDSSLSKVLQIRGVEFDWKPLTEEEKKTIHGNEGHDVGVIAQEIEKVLPEVVTERENGYKAVKYEKIVPLLIEAIKEQSDIIEKLEERIKNLEKGSNN